MNYQIHIGQRIEYFITNAPRGKGLNGFAAFIGRSKSVVYNMYKADDVDFKVVLKACEYYGISLSVFLGLNGSELNHSEQISVRAPEHGEIRMDRIEGKLDKILKLLDTT